jgi:hypothetical protein
MGPRVSYMYRSSVGILQRYTISTICEDIQVYTTEWKEGLLVVLSSYSTQPPVLIYIGSMILNLFMVGTTLS